MSLDPFLDLLLEAATLKRMPRTGWGTRGVPHVESVAEHSFGVAFVALTLTDILNQERDAGDQTALNLERVLVMALLHDLAEVRLTDLPSSALRLIPAAVKSQAEKSAMADLLSPLPTVARWQAWWEDFEERTSDEGHLVRDADKLEMMIQCLRYEEAGSRGLDEFWQAMDHYPWHYALSEELYAGLKEKRPRDAERRTMGHDL